MATENKNIIITVGRQYGSGGRMIGRRLADTLGFGYYDKELLCEAAKELGVSEEIFMSHDEKTPSFFGGLFPTSFGYGSMTGYGARAISTDERLYEVQTDVIRNIAQRESAVIVGRTADYVLRDNPRCVNIFIHADENACAKRLIDRREYEKLSDALAAVRRVNKLRASFYNFYSDKTWGAASSYDLCVNSTNLSVDDVVEIVRKFIELRFGSI